MKTYFPSIEKIRFEGPDSKNPLSFKYYDEHKIIGGKSMKEHLRFAVCYWHTFCGDGSDLFGYGTRVFPWNSSLNSLDNAKFKLDAAFEFFTKLGIPFYCFHDRDIAPEGKTISETEKYLYEILNLAKEKQEETNIKLLWGTANLFSHPRYMNGAATNPEFSVLCMAAAQVKTAIDATMFLGGSGFVFWGGREGYTYLFNTDMKRERNHLGEFFRLARDYARKNGFKGTFFIEPKPMEPLTHQYDFDAATVIGFLKEFKLENDFKLNIEANHATLANHSFSHELQVAANANMLGSIDANRGEPQNGWDTDNFPLNLYDAIEAMLVILENGGFIDGGINFDAKLRRNSTDIEDLFISHIAGMDTFARALIIANNLINDGFLAFRKKRYKSFDSGKGAEFENKKLSLIDLYNYAIQQPETPLISGKQEFLEAMINQYIR